ncbi:triple tyrosine motif-containing protein [Fulvivirga sediminis]|uniref:Two component regulator three y domain-containing protein n=1 Tax=Fulvivirga sediminis TaxID=2803949 RepID=A0A937JXE3_9BACT|nr:triple tyrosine motif-containing protein [Fulvivirga sediminis]MBL3655403.1 two component regulator three y domain-containing protein [Fulvivirga sediminis]
MKKQLFIIAIIVLSSKLCSSQNYNLGLPFIRYYATNEYNGGIQNWSITQNKYGLIYVANNFGILEYDGTNWTIYGNKQGTKARHIAINDKGRIFVASQGDFGYLCPNKTGQLSYTSLADSLPKKYRDFDETWKVFINNDRVIFGTFKYIFVYNEEGKIEVLEPNYPPENIFFVNHELYVNQLETGLSSLHNQKLTPLPYGEKLKNIKIASVLPLTGDNLWIATENEGIFTTSSNNITQWKGSLSIFKEASIKCALRLRNGNFAIGTQNKGLFILSPQGELILHLNKDQGLNNRTVLCLFEDLQNNLWLGHNNGITYVELGMPFTYINEQVGLPGSGYVGFLDGNNLYLGTNNGLFYKNIKTQATEEKYKFIPNTDGQVYSIDKIKQNLLIGHHKGALIIKDKQAENISNIPGSWTFLSLKDHPDYVIEGCYKGLNLYKIENGQLHFKHKIKGFNESSRVMQQDKNGDIWMTHGYKGIYRLTLDENLDSIKNVRFYGEEKGLPSNLMINVFKINNRLVFTTTNQIYRYDEPSDQFVLDNFFSPYFKDEVITALADDTFQNIYFLSPDEIGMLESKPTGGFAIKKDIFNKLQNMLNDDLQNVNILNANQVLYAAKEGFILYDANQKKLPEQNFHTLIRSVKISGDSAKLLFNGFFTQKGQITNLQPKDQIPHLEYSNNSIQISYSAAYLDGLEGTQYKFWLENADKKWSAWTAKTEKEYTNLNEGTYTFHVKASNIYGKESQIAHYTFVVLPPWYRTTWAYLTYSVIIIMLLFVSFYLFDKKHKREKMAMSLTQEKELHRKDSEIETITKETAGEIQRLKNENLQREIENKNKELATSTMHLINKNGFISNIKSNLSGISKRSKNQEVKKELRKIIANIDKNISQDADWEHFSFHFDRVHGDFTNRLKKSYPNLSPQEMKLSAYLRMNLSTKEVAQLLNISVRGVEICRYRLRKKLELERSTNLQEFILKF